MKKRRLISTALTIILVLCSIGSINIFAAEGTILYSEDFENQMVGSAPTNVYSGAANNKYTDESKTVISAEYATVKNDTAEGIGNYLDLVPAVTNSTQASSESAKIFFSESVDKNDGTIVIEYDGLIDVKNGDGNNGRKHIFAAFVNSGRTAINKVSEILNHKGSDVGNKDGFQEYKYDLNDGNGVYSHANTRGLLYYADAPAEAMLRTRNVWHHYKMEINLAEGTQQLWIDGRASEIWTDKELYTKIAYEGQSIDALYFQNYLKDTNMTEWKIDNIKVYKPAPDVTKMTVNSYDGKTSEYAISAGENTISNVVTTMLQDLTLEFGSKMNKTTVSATLYNNTTAADEPVTLIWAESNRSAAVQVNRKYLVSGNSYTLTVSGQDVSGNSFTQPTVINFTAGNDGGLAIISAEILKAGNTVDFSTLSAGDTVAVKVTYVLTDETKSKSNIILALTGEKNNKLCGFKQAVVNFDEPGSNTKSVEFVIGDTVPNRLSAFMWSLDLRQVVLDNVTIFAE